MTIKVLSNRADLISGGRALVEVKLPRAVDPRRVRVAVRAGRRVRDQSSRFKLRPDGRYMGNARLLRNGRNTLVVRVSGRVRDRARVVNHPVGGPVFSGPQIQPWECQETAVDEQCNQPQRFELFYKPSGGGDFEPYDAEGPPDDVAMTTTDEGVTVPFIVRLETGYQDRDQYKIASLFQPGERWRPWAPQEQWNGKLLITHGGGCGASYGAGSAPDVFGPVQIGIPGVDEVLAALEANDVGGPALGRGFAVMSTALNNTGHNCNLAVEAESMVMAKERIVESYGPLRYTIGYGCSGGSVAQQWIANAYPGIYQGLIVTCSYPDVLSPGTEFADYHGLRLYFEDPSRWGPGIVWSPTQMAAVEGHITHLNAITADEGLFKSAVDPQHPCRGTTDENRYHPERNPGGVRCSILDYMINLLGPRPKREWTAVERRRGQGFAGVPLGNEGVQYGLAALRRGEITPAQFVDLNVKAGGLDIDINLVPERIPGHERALRNSYRTGLVNSANNLDSVAIIDHGGPDPGLAHDARWAWVMRERLEREHGHSANHVIWFGQAPLIGDPGYGVEALGAMDRWMTAVERDGRRRSLSRKIVDNRPPDLEDRCSQLAVLELVEVPGVGKVCELDLVQTRLGTPRTVAGQDFTTDRSVCKLKPLSREADYGPIGLSDQQWASLQEAFPRGVCEWAHPGTGEGPTVQWLIYEDRRGEVVHGGRRLGRAPKGSGAGLSSRSFRSWRRAR